MSRVLIDLARRIGRPPGRVAVGLLCCAVAVSLTGPALPARARPSATRLAAQVDKPIPGVPLAARARPADPAAAAAARTAAQRGPVWPAASTVDVTLPAAGDAVPAGGLPVSLARVTTAAVRADAAAAAPARLRLAVLDRGAARAVGVAGTVLRLERVDGGTATVSSRLSVDYGRFASAYGADWTSRLRLLRLPACALSTPAAAGCATGTVLPSTNDVTAGRISASVAVPADGAVVALAAGGSGNTGDFGATTLTSSSTWSAGGNAGAFAWKYPIRVPPSLGGPAPEIALSYSSQSVDGRSAVTNNQPSWIGEGFEWSPGFIERRYKSCAEDMDGSGHNNATKTGDLCWETDNATLSLSGHSSELIKDGSDPNRWHLRNDDGTLVLHKTGGGNGDNDGEWWQVITPDGTQYRLGGTPASNSTLTEPVYGNDPGEPCRQATFAASSCTQAYRWNLDNMVDTHGNTMTYTYRKETNKYGRNNSTSDLVAYDRAGYVETISYGTRVGGTGPAPMQVSFATADRCLTSSCGTHDGVNWTDTPWDQECTTAPCLIGSPTFWTTKRLASITTKVWNPSATPPGYRNVESWTFTHTFPNPGDTTRAGLWLAKISHSGLVGTTTSVPDLTFSGVQLRNRVDTLTDGKLPMNWWRISRIDTETGGAILVKYSDPDCVPGSRMPNESALQDNTLRCYPVTYKEAGSETVKTDYFHKYLVTEVREGDLVGGAPDVVHAYEYVGNPAWHYTDDDGLVKSEFKTWSVWRGYDTVRVRTGDAATTTRTYNETRFFRGMNGDHLPSGARSVTLPAVDVNGSGGSGEAGVDAPAVADEDAYAGMTRMSTTFNGAGGPEVSATVSEPWQSAPTASRTINGTTVHARFTRVAATHNRAALDADGGRRTPGVRTTSSRSTFDSMGMTIEVDDRGDDAVGGDETCQLTTYVRNTNPATAVWLTSFPSRKQSFAVGCAAAKAGGLGEADVTGDDRTAYDGLAFGAPPTKGDATQTQALKAYGPGPTYVTVGRAAYDAYGRQTDTWDIDNNHVTTVYTPSAGGPVTQMAATNQVGWTTTTTVEPAWGSALSVVDANGRRTDVAYDGLGRTTAVWLPGQSRAANQPASATYAYLLRVDGANAITTKRLNAAGGYVSTIALFDGLVRPRQNQSPDASIAGARIVTDTLYDSAGRAWKTTRAYPMTGPPATDIYVPRPPDYSGPEAIPAWTESVFDGTGRVITSIVKARNVEKWRTTTVYTGDRTEVTTPVGDATTSSVTDAHGRTVSLRQYHTNTPTGAFDTTTYTYNRKGQLTRLTDPRGTQWTYTYDLRGRQIQVDDPDKGRMTRTYDDAGRTLTGTDARGTTVAYTYDALGRKTSARNGSATGTKRAEWVYDTVAGGRGELAKSIRYDAAGNAYTNEVLGYNVSGQPTSVRYSLPASETSFGASSFTYIYTYNVDGSPATSRTPAAGDLGTENLTYGYTPHGRPSTLSSNLGATLVTDTGYTNYGESNIVTLRNNGGGIVQIGHYYEDDTRRLRQIKTTSAVAPTTTFLDLTYTYTDAGDITKLAESVSGDTQCFGYDGLRRLTQAWTPASGSCAAAPTVGGLGGPARYWQSWTFDAVGDRLSQTDHAATNTTATYSYPSTTGPHPHAVSSVAYTGGVTRTDSYAYDANGNTTSRPGQTITWDAEDRVSTSVDATGTTSYLYDVDGGRLVRSDPAGKTLYLPGQEIRYTAATGTRKATRYYSYGSMTIATRSASGLTWLAGDNQGTAQVAIKATTQAAAVRRFTPYGSPRGTTSGAWPSTMDKGFVGGTVDNTGLTHLGAREYDPTLGRFISVDPVFNDKDPQSWQGYAYANNTPVTASDPTGLCIKIESFNGPCASQINTPAGERKLNQVAADEARRQAGPRNFATFCHYVPSAPECLRGRRTDGICQIIICTGPPSLLDMLPPQTPQPPATGPDLSRHQYYDQPYNQQCYSPSVGLTGGCYDGEKINFICSDRKCSNFLEATGADCSTLCVVKMLFLVLDFLPMPGHTLWSWIVEKLFTITAGVIVGKLPGAHHEGMEMPELPSDLNVDFHPVVLGFDTSLYQGKPDIPKGFIGPVLESPFYSPTVPTRTATQVTGTQVVFPKGTVVWEGVVNGQRQIYVPDAWHMPGSTTVATWTLP